MFLYSIMVSILPFKGSDVGSNPTTDLNNKKNKTMKLKERDIIKINGIKFSVRCYDSERCYLSNAGANDLIFSILGIYDKFQFSKEKLGYLLSKLVSFPECKNFKDLTKLVKAILTFGIKNKKLDIETFLKENPYKKWLIEEHCKPICEKPQELSQIIKPSSCLDIVELEKEVKPEIIKECNSVEKPETVEDSDDYVKKVLERGKKKRSFLNH